MNTKRSRITRLATGSLAAAVIVATYGCEADRNVVAPPQTNSAAAAARTFVGANPSFDPRVAPADRLHPSAVAALQRTAWVGRIHRDGLAEFAQQRVKGGPAEANCAILAKVIARHVPDAEAESGIKFSGQGRRDVVREAVRSTGPCAGYQPMSLWNAAASASATGGGNDLVSDRGIAYGESMINAVRGVNGYRPYVDEEVYRVLNEAVAAGLSTADLDYVAGVGNEAISSSQYWNEVELGYGGSLPGLNPADYVMAIWAYVALDALGCGVGAGSAYIGGERRTGALLAQCALVGIGSSAGGFLGTRLM
ncbi:MAG TPA: hypothetical protein VEZ12_03310 [Herpetosiphonaceae bacterium]|nr:hypothetical protein [Herpetosiphonaceae bacterium]